MKRKFNPRIFKKNMGEAVGLALGLGSVGVLVYVMFVKLVGF